MACLKIPVKALLKLRSPFFIPWSEVLVAQSCLTLCNPRDYSPLGSSVLGIFQTRILEWIAISFSRRSSQPRDQTWVSCIVGRFFSVWPTREAPFIPYYLSILFFVSIMATFFSPFFCSPKILESNFLKRIISMYLLLHSCFNFFFY